MLDYRRMLMEDFSLSPEIILSCRGEIEHHCSGLHRKGRTLHCLMKVVRGEKGNLGMNCQQAVRENISTATLVLVLLRITIAVLKHHNQSNLGENGVYFKYLLFHIVVNH